MLFVILYTCNYTLPLIGEIHKLLNKVTTLYITYFIHAYVDVIVLKRSCPAVSQICSFTFSPPTSIVLILKSTPIVVMYVPIQQQILIILQA